MTKARPTPEPLHLGLRERGFAPGVVSPLTFFEPASHGVARDAKDAGQATQGGALVIGPEDLFLAGRVVSGGGGVLHEAASAPLAAVTLLAFPGVSVADGTVAMTMSATGDVGCFFHHVR